MKIPELLAQGDLAITPLPYTDPSAAAQGGVTRAGAVIGGRVEGAGRLDAGGPTRQALGQIGQGLGQIGQGLERLGAREQLIAAEIRKKDIETKATQGFLDFAVGIDDDVVRIQNNPALDHTTLVPTYEGTFAEKKRHALEKAGDDDVRALLGAKIDSIYRAKRHEVQGFATKQYIAGEVASADQMADTFAKLAAKEANPALALALEREYDAWLLSRRGGVFTDEQINDRRTKFRGQVAESEFNRLIDSDPDAAVREGRKLFADRLPPLTMDRLEQKADRRAEALSRQRTAEQEKFYTALEKEAEQERKAQVDDLTSRAAAGGLTLDTLEDFRRMRVATGEDYRRLQEMVTRPKEAPSDRATLDDVDARLYRSTPQVTEGELLALRRSGRLNDKDFVERSKALTSRHDHLRAEGRTIANQELSQAEQLIHKGLGFTGPFDQLDQESKQLLAMAFRELTARSKGGGLKGTERAGDVALDILGRIQPIREQSMALSADKLRGTLRFPTRETLEAARLRIGESAYIEELRKFSELDRAEQRQQQRQKPKTPGGKGTLGRGPKTPVVTGNE